MCQPILPVPLCQAGLLGAGAIIGGGVMPIHLIRAVMRLLLFIVFAGLPQVQQAASHLHAKPLLAMERRDATAQERLSFARFYKQQFSVSPPEPVALVGERARGRHAQWTLATTVDAAPTKGTGPLCTMSRASFGYSAHTSSGARWQQLSRDEQWVWINRTGPCGKPTQAVRLLAPMAGQDILGLLEGQQALLQRARLLMAGNSSCAALRSLPFNLASISLAPPAPGKAALPVLAFESDRSSTARVWVRSSGTQLTAWNTECAGSDHPHTDARIR